MVDKYTPDETLTEDEKNLFANKNTNYHQD